MPWWWPFGPPSPIVLYDVARFLWKKLRKESRVFKPFRKKNTIVILSSLAPINPSGSVFKPEELVKPPDTYRGPIVQAPHRMTGTNDAFGLARLATKLVATKIDFRLRIDPVPEVELSDANLILIGSPSSNLASKKLYEKYAFPGQTEFEYDSSYGVMTFKGNSYREGSHAVALRVRNPWNRIFYCVLLAGLGPTGTEAAIAFACDYFDTDKVPGEIKNADEWICLIQGIPPDGPIRDVDSLGNKAL